MAIQLLVLIKELIKAQLVVEESAEFFAFRHALTREVIYASLLVRERRMMHGAIAETMELVSTRTLQSHYPSLAYHYYEAGRWAKALEYSQRAGEQAHSFYAPREAIEHYTRALAAAHELALKPPPDLHRARGLSYVVVGDFDRALADLDASLELARAAADLRTEGLALIELGNLWASRDYARAGAFFQEGLALARHMNDPTALAHSLNRLGNWHVNVEQPQKGLDFHQEALSIFRQLHDRRGIAETLDLAGMACYLGSEIKQGTDYYEQALSLFTELDDRQGMSSSLATLTMRGATYQTNLTLCPVIDLSVFLQEEQRAIQIARDIGWRSGEAYAEIMPSFCLGSKGDYGLALELAMNGLAIADEIGHRQWMAAAHATLGGISLDLLAYELSRQHLERALRLAEETGSLHWIRTTKGFASACIYQGDLVQARLLLEGVQDDESRRAVTLGQRLAWCSLAELALAQGGPDITLEIVERLLAPYPNDRRILRLLQLKGDALAAKHEYAQAEAWLQTAQEASIAHTALPMQWRIWLSLGKVYQAQKRLEESRTAVETAVSIIETLAVRIPEKSLEHQFRSRAMARAAHFPHRKKGHTPRQVAKKQFSGLTARERQVAVLVAQGRSNRQIADELVLSERTVEGHVGGILSKLNFSSRVQIAAWAFEIGLANASSE